MLKEILDDLKSKDINKVYVNYRDVDGVNKNICYQDGIFFTVESGKAKRLEPITAAETIEMIIKKDLKFMGKGYYTKTVDIHNKNKRGVI